MRTLREVFNLSLLKDRQDFLSVSQALFSMIKSCMQLSLSRNPILYVRDFLATVNSYHDFSMGQQSFKVAGKC